MVNSNTNTANKRAKNVPVWRNVLLNDVCNITFQDLPVQPVSDDINPPYLKMFVDHILLDLLAEQSNIYSLHVTPKEKEQFIVVYFCMGLVQVSSIRSYWERYMTCDGVSSETAFFQFFVTFILRGILE